jgi:hypothetical protein
MLEVGGMKVIVNDALAEFDLVRRTWAERLWSLPWRPWVSFRQEPKPPTFIVDQARGVIYTTQRGLLALRAETNATAH